MSQYHFCPICGTPVNGTYQYCPNCGAKLWDSADGHQYSSTPPARQYQRGTFSRMLAYIPGLFWVPLAADSTDKNNRECANQGLLLLLYCIAISIIFSAAGHMLAYAWVSSAIGGNIFAGAVSPYPHGYSYPRTGAANSLISSVILAIYTVFTLYVPINSIWGFIHCINHSEPHVLPVIGKIKIIKA